MNILHLFDDISLGPIREDWERLSGKSIKADLIAGITVALLTLPQTMAYALLAGLPLSCGLFAAIFSAMIASIFGGSRHLIFGPTNAIAILIQVGTAEILFTYFRELTGVDRELMALQLLTQMTALVALFQMIGAAFNFGKLIRFVSQPVISGYLLGVVTAVVVTQSYTFLGIPPLQGYHSLYDKAIYLMAHVREADLSTFLVGLFSLSLLFGIKRLNSRLPSGILMLIGVSLAVNLVVLVEQGGLFGLFEPFAGPASAIQTVGDSGILSGIGGALQLPYFNWKIMDAMVPFAFAVACLSILEASSVSRMLASRSGEALAPNQELFALGLGNIVSALTVAMPISASPSRTSVNYEMGAKSRLSAVIGAVAVAFLVGVFGSFVSLVPLTALAALLIVAVRHIVDLKQLALCVRATHSDAFVLLATFTSCLIFSLDTAFYIGVAISITLYLRKAAIPQVTECRVGENGQLYPLFNEEKIAGSKIRFIKVEGELFFGAADLFHSSLKTFASRQMEAHVLVLQLRNARDMDATACLMLKQLCDYLHHSGRHLVLCGMTSSVMRVIVDSGLATLIGTDNLFALDRKAHHLHMQKAMTRAEELVAIDEKSSCEDELFPINSEHDKFTSQELIRE